MPHEMPFFEETVTITGAAGAGDTFSVDVPEPDVPLRNGRSRVAIYNGTPVDVTVSLLNRETMGGAARFPQIGTFGVPAGGTVYSLAEGFLVAESPSRLDVTTDAAMPIGSADSPVHIRIRRAA